MTLTTERAPQPYDRSRGKKPGLFERIAIYNRQVVAELRKVIWPTRNELVTYTIVSIVVACVIFFVVAAIVGSVTAMFAPSITVPGAGGTLTVG